MRAVSSLVIHTRLHRHRYWETVVTRGTDNKYGYCKWPNSLHINHTHCTLKRYQSKTEDDYIHRQTEWYRVPKYVCSYGNKYQLDAGDSAAVQHPLLWKQVNITNRWLLCGEHIQYISLDMITKPHNQQYSMWNLLNVDTVVHSEHFWIFLPFPDRRTMHIFKWQINMNVNEKAQNTHTVSCCQREWNYEVSSFHRISHLSFYDCQKPLMYKKGEQNSRLNSA